MSDDARQLAEDVGDCLYEVEHFPEQYSLATLEKLEPRLDVLEKAGVNVRDFRRRVGALVRHYRLEAIREERDSAESEDPYEKYNEMYYR